MEQTLKNYFWIANLLVLAIAMFLMAQLASTFVTYFLNKPSAPKGKSAMELSNQAQSLANTSASKDAILNRNLFNKNVKESETEGLAPRMPIEGQEAVKTDLNIELVGTVVTPDPKKSVTTLALAKEKFRYHVGELLDKKHEVQKILRGRVEFINQNTGRLEYIAFPEPAPQAPPPTRESGIKTNALAEPPTGEGITQNSDREFTISQTEWDGQLANLNSIITQARAVPNLVNGQAEGFRIFAIRPGSIYQRLGIQNGDILMAVNSRKIDSINSAMGMFESLKSQKSFELVVNRNGKDETLSYNIR